MADPVTMAIVAGLQVAGGIQEFQQNRAMAQATKAQTAANIKNQQASFEIERDKLRREQQQFAGKQVAQAAGTGATLGSFDTLFGDTARVSMVDQALLEYDNKLKQEGIRYEGAMKKKQYYMAGRSALLKAVGGAASTVATTPGAAKSFGQATPRMGQAVGRAVSSNPYGPQLPYGSRTIAGYS